ncbi:killer cell lectin-like receptor subfamily B member 1B allele A isoform X1 [Lepisosteus oculatus]|uniref:killer cell lectin-like receptor subfamily B member 1B allele A isoform X1 n=1 Tax=Lepisosteus oculatus TaxID=7918 RepID=UPI00371A2258
MSCSPGWCRREAVAMSESVTYTEIKFKRDPAQEASLAVNPPSNTPPSAQLYSKQVVYVLGTIVLVLLIIVFGLTLAIAHLQREKCSPDSMRHREQMSCDQQCMENLITTHEDRCQLLKKWCGWNTRPHEGLSFSQWIKHKQIYYSFVQQNETWETAAQICSEEGGQLVVIKDLDTIEFIRQNLLGNYHYWIGLKKNESINQWQWLGNIAFNSTFSFSNTNHTHKDCAIISKVSFFADECRNRRFSICEKIDINKQYFPNTICPALKPREKT